MNPPSKRRFVKREEDDDRPDDSQDEAIEDRDLEMDEEAAGEGQEEEGEVVGQASLRCALEGSISSLPTL